MLLSKFVLVKYVTQKSLLHVQVDAFVAKGLKHAVSFSPVWLLFTIIECTFTVVVVMCFTNDVKSPSRCIINSDNTAFILMITKPLYWRPFWSLLHVNSCYCIRETNKNQHVPPHFLHFHFLLLFESSHLGLKPPLFTFYLLGDWLHFHAQAPLL